MNYIENSFYNNATNLKTMTDSLGLNKVPMSSNEFYNSYLVDNTMPIDSMSPNVSPSCTMIDILSTDPQFGSIGFSGANSPGSGPSICFNVHDTKQCLGDINYCANWHIADWTTYPVQPCRNNVMLAGMGGSDHGPFVSGTLLNPLPGDLYYCLTRNDIPCSWSVEVTICIFSADFSCKSSMDFFGCYAIDWLRTGIEWWGM